MTGHRNTVWQRGPSALRVAPVVVLCLISTATLPVLAQAPAKGTRDPLGPLRRPAHLRAGSPEPVLRLRLRADGGAQRAAAAALRAGARPRRRVLRRAVPRRRSLGAHQRHSRARRRSGRRGRAPEFGPLIEAFVRGLNAWAAEHKADLSPEAQARAARDRRGRLRALPARDPLRLDHQSRRSSRRGWRAPTSRRTARTSGRSRRPARRPARRC